MTIRKQAFWTIAIPVAALMTVADAPVQAQPPTDQSMASRSGIDLAALDRSADPCSDFYQYACGGMVNQPICRVW